MSYKEGNKYREKADSGFKTKKGAQLAAAVIEERLHRGANINRAEQTFCSYFRNWYETFRKGKKSSYNDQEIERAVRFAEKSFPGVKFKDLDREMYQKALNNFAKNHATATVRKHHIYMKACIQDALNDHVIFRDPTYKAVTIGNAPEKKEAMKYINFSDSQRLITELRSNLQPRYISRYMILFGLATGCRFGEMLGMTWNCIDTKKRTVRINKTWDYHSTQTFGTTKNEASNRVIRIDKATCSWLNELKMEQDNSINKLNLVFVNKKMELVTNTAVNKCLKQLCGKLGITEITCHGLRHTHASILLYKGVSINYLSRRLGHDSVLTTMRVYTHILDELAQRDSETTDAAMDDLFQVVK